MGGSFGLLHPVAFHNLTIPVDADIPGAARLGLTVQHGRIRDVVVFKHALFKLALGSEVLLRNKERK